MLQRLWISIRRNKFTYYVRAIARELIPNSIYRNLLKTKPAFRNDDKEITRRINYYNRLSPGTKLGEAAIPLSGLAVFGDPKVYNFDTREYTRYFPQHLKAEFLFGDIDYTTERPTVQKSRPVGEHARNSVIINMEKKRHFFFIKDRIAFRDKKDMLIGRATVRQPHRIRFMEQYFDNRLCDLGQINTEGGNPRWLKDKLHIVDHLPFKFILSLEGNDVATNLKWIMSSNSLAVMPMPRFETWYMEGLLEPDIHFVRINDDFSNLEERLQFYIDHPEEGETIIRNAHAWVDQFLDKNKEDTIALGVLEKYFECTGQAIFGIGNSESGIR